MSWAAAAFIGSYPSPYNTRRDSDFDNYTTTYTCNYKIKKIMFLTTITHTHTHNHIYMLLLFFEGCSAASQGCGLTL